ncbi:MAG: PIN domain-containing protein [Candidatus Rokubacteria bacterium]|nr:PIN domain-containing protein [Candidatus Rokubacteria bacterium]
MIRGVVLDTGPLVAFVDRRDRYHRWAATHWSDVAPPLLTCEPVLTEACFLVRELPRGPSTILELVGRGIVNVAYDIESDVEALRRLMMRYANVPMSLADACLVRMVERHPAARVLTLDRDFRVYRAHGRRVIPALMPSDL